MVTKHFYQAINHRRNSQNVFFEKVSRIYNYKQDKDELRQVFSVIQYHYDTFYQHIQQISITFFDLPNLLIILQDILLDQCLQICLNTINTLFFIIFSIQISIIFAASYSINLQTYKKHNNLVYNQMNLQRPLQLKATPKQDKNTTEHDQQIKQSMKKQIQRLNSQNFELKDRCRNTSLLEQKVHIWEKENQNLHKENQKLSKYLNQLKIENQQLKQKFEVMYEQKIRDYEESNRTMSKKIQILEDKINQENTFKSTSLEDIKSQYQLQIKHLKKKVAASQQGYEAQIRRLRQQLQKRSNQMMQNANKLKKMNIESEYQMVRLKQEKQRLKNQLTFCEHDKIKQLQQMKKKFQQNYLSQTQQLKRLYETTQQQLRTQNRRMQTELQQKIQELQSITNKSNRQKHYYQDSINYLKKDCQNYRIRLIQTQRLYNLEIQEIKQQLNLIHIAQIQEIRFRHQLQIKSKDQEIKRLQKIIDGKNDEIQVLIKEKIALRGNYDKEIMKIKDDYRAILQNFEELTIKSTQQMNQSSKRLSEKDKHITYLSDLLKNIKSSHQNQKSNYKNQIQYLKQQNFKQRQDFSNKENSLKTEISRLQNQLDTMKKNYEQTIKKLQLKINELQNELNGTSADLTSKADNLNSQYLKLLAQNENLKQTISQKEGYITLAKSRIKQSEEIETNLQNQIIKLRQKGIARQKSTNDNFERLKKTIQQTYAAQFDNIKKRYEARLLEKEEQIKSLMERLSKKQAELTKLLQNYQIFMKQVNEIVEQEANKKDIDIKFAGATGKLVRLKNTFDVFLKMKIIKVCNLSALIP